VIQTTASKSFQFLLTLIGVIFVSLFIIKINVSNSSRKSHGDNSGHALRYAQRSVLAEKSLYTRFSSGTYNVFIF